MTTSSISWRPERCEGCNAQGAGALRIPIGGGFVTYCRLCYSRGLRVLQLNAAQALADELEYLIAAAIRAGLSANAVAQTLDRIAAYLSEGAA